MSAPTTAATSAPGPALAGSGGRATPNVNTEHLTVPSPAFSRLPHGRFLALCCIAVARSIAPVQLPASEFLISFHA